MPLAHSHALCALSDCRLIARRLAKDPRFERLPCSHRGTYADDCIVERVQQVGAHPLPYPHASSCFYNRMSTSIPCHLWHLESLTRLKPEEARTEVLASESPLCCLVLQHRCFVVATCDKDLKRRLRKVRLLYYTLEMGVATSGCDVDVVCFCYVEPDGVFRFPVCPSCTSPTASTRSRGCPRRSEVRKQETSIGHGRIRD